MYCRRPISTPTLTPERYPGRDQELSLWEESKDMLASYLSQGIAAESRLRKTCAELRPLFGEPVRAAMRDPVESATTQPPQRRYVLGQQHQAERQHPYAEKRQNAKGAAAEQQYPRRDPHPA